MSPLNGVLIDVGPESSIPLFEMGLKEVCSNHRGLPVALFPDTLAWKLTSVN